MGNIVGVGLTTNINDFNKDKWQVRFSNIPNLTNKPIDMHVVNNYVKTFQIPDLQVAMLTSVYGHSRQLNPNPQGARNLQTFNIEMKMDENGLNWFLFNKWATGMLNGEYCGKKNADGEELLRMDCIDAVEVVFLNNDNEITSKFIFKHCILSNLGSFQLEQGQSNLCTYIVTFDYEELEYRILTKDLEDAEYETDNM